VSASQLSPAPVIDRATSDLALLARVSGVLYVCGSALVVISVALPHPSSVDIVPLYAIAAVAFAAGVGMYWHSRRMREWMLHTVLACASVLVSACVYFSGIAAGVYSAMFVWVVIVAACIASRPALTLHITWLMFTYGIAMVGLEGNSAAFSPVTRFVLTGFALGAAGAAVSWLVEGRRTAEAGLHREIETREKLQRELEHLANHDPLTGVANRRRLEERLPVLIAEADHSGRPLSLIALDLDGFKAFNDRHGHAAGDRLLKGAASAWSTVLREDDLITRMGGDEFLVVLPNCPPGEAKRIALRLRDAVPEGQTCSAGVAFWNGQDSAEDLLLVADKALYETKGRRGGTLAA
jgi:diguanylate cyclase (GGDEF)-like protein